MSDSPEETLLEFPCRFPIKMMGRDSERFRRVAVELVEMHAGKIPEDSIRVSASRLVINLDAANIGAAINIAMAPG